jgi:hypothetical protein
MAGIVWIDRPNQSMAIGHPKGPFKHNDSHVLLT